MQFVEWLRILQTEELLIIHSKIIQTFRLTQSKKNHYCGIIKSLLGFLSCSDPLKYSWVKLCKILRKSKVEFTRVLELLWGQLLVSWNPGLGTLITPAHININHPSSSSSYCHHHQKHICVYTYMHNYHLIDMIIIKSGHI